MSETVTLRALRAVGLIVAAGSVGIALGTALTMGLMALGLWAD